MAWLTKSRFLSGLQCSKRLWFEVHEPLDEPPEPDVAVLQGRLFDEFVQQLQLGPVISRKNGMPAAIATTKRLLQVGGPPPPILYQPAFLAVDLAVIADVLRWRGEAFDLIEVKSSTVVKDTHLPDAAF